MISPFRKTHRRGRCSHRPAPNKTGNSPLTVGANIVRPMIPLHFRQHRPRENTVKPSGGIARFPRCPPGLANAIVALSGTCNAGFFACCLCRRSMLFFGVCSAIIPFFFSLLKRKKEAKKEKLSPTLVSHGNALHERQHDFRYAQQKSPGGGEQAAAAAVRLPFSLRLIGG